MNTSNRVNLYQNFKHLGLYITLATLCCLSSAVPVYADSLAAIQESAVLNRFYKENEHNRRQKTGNWLPRGKNFSRVFANSNGAELIHSWLTIPTTAFRTTHETALTFTEYALATRHVLAKSGATIKLSVFLPHPRYEAMAKANLVRNMAKLEPPVLDVEYSEDYVLQEQDAVLYHQRDKACSLLFKLDKASKIHLQTECEHTKDMLELGKVITIDRFKKKINS